MFFDKINIEEIKVQKAKGEFYDVMIDDTNIEFWTPPLFIPFGIDRKFNNFFINFELDIENDLIEYFYNFLVNIENKLIELLGIEKHQLNSQLRITKRNPMLYTKIINKNDKILSVIKKENGEFMNFYKIDKKITAKVKICIDNIWHKNGIYYYKYKIKELVI